MQRTFIVLLLIAITSSACVSSPSLWGVAPTPTPDQPIPTSPPVLDPFALVDDPIVFPTSTTPPSIATNSALALTPNPTTENTPSALLASTPTPDMSDKSPFLYYAQSGDMLSAVASRFGVSESEITSNADLTRTTLIDPGTLLVIPNRINEPTTPNIQIVPDAEIIFSITAADFNVDEFVEEQGGYLSVFEDYLGSTGKIKGSDAIERLAYENSINPRMLLGLLEYESNWVRGQPVDILHTDYPMGFNDYHYKGMSVQLVWAANNLSIGYYGWRAGTLTHIDFPDGTSLRLDPRLNAGTVAIQYLFSRLYNQSRWSQIINPESGFPAVYRELFGDPWTLAEDMNPIFPAALNQPNLTLPFAPNEKWSYTGGPHNGWGQLSPEIYGETHSVFAAIDFAPAAGRSGCIPTNTWVLASAPGLVVRSENGAVMVDLDGDGYEQTGWNLLYMHISSQNRVSKGTWLEAGDRIGHASCEGGVSTGTHLHFARKYNGEWVTADGPIPFVLSGWRVYAGVKPYQGTLVKGERIVIADINSESKSIIIREDE